MALHIPSVDLQNEFAVEGGALYRPRPCVPFIRDTFLPFVRARGYTIAEIISDYRITAPTVGTPTCVPGQWGYQSLIPTDTGTEEHKQLLIATLFPFWGQAIMWQDLATAT